MPLSATVLATYLEVYIPRKAIVEEKLDLKF